MTGPEVLARWAAIDARAYELVRSEVARAVLEDAGQGTADPLDLYRAAHGGGADWPTYLDVAGLAVRDLVRGWLDELSAVGWRARQGVPAFMLSVLRDALDLGNRQAWADVAESFMPEPDELAGGGDDD